MPVFSNIKLLFKTAHGLLSAFNLTFSKGSLLPLLSNMKATPPQPSEGPRQSFLHIQKLILRPMIRCFWSLSLIFIFSSMWNCCNPTRESLHFSSCGGRITQRFYSWNRLPAAVLWVCVCLYNLTAAPLLLSSVTDVMQQDCCRREEAQVPTWKAGMRVSLCGIIRHYTVLAALKAVGQTQLSLGPSNALYVHWWCVWEAPLCTSIFNLRNILQIWYKVGNPVQKDTQINLLSLLRNEYR